MSACKTMTSCVGIMATLIVLTCGENSHHRAFDAILELYDTYDIVHIGERHWNMTDYDFRLALINYPRFAETVDDIVVECGNHLYQDILDAYILELEDVPESELRQVWRNHLISNGVWNATIYKDFVHAVRKVNETLSSEDRIRLVAAEPSIDWARIENPDQYRSFMGQRGTYPASIIKTEVIDKKRKALVIYGAAHFYRSGNQVLPPGRLRENLEESMGRRIFTIMPLSGDNEFSRNFEAAARTSECPTFVNLTISDLADLPAGQFFIEGYGPVNGLTDGILYLGSQPDAEATYDPDAANDSSYQAELQRRRAIVEQGW